MGPEQTLSAMRETILAAAASGTALEVHGGRTKRFLGNEPRGEPFDVRAYAGITSYEPTELVVTARSGTPLAELEATLAERGQMLAFEPPHFGEGATVGGTIACGVSGPGRVAAGAARDFVLGAALLAASGELMYFGGQVMKNVAGYDISRLLCGSYGVLGVIAEVSLKVLPVPPARTSLRVAADAAEAVRLLNGWGGEPLPISASCWLDGEVWLRLAGSQAGVEAAAERFMARHGASVVDAGQAATFWHDLAEQRLPFFASQGSLWRVSVPSTAPQLELGGPQLIEWGGGLRWFVGPDEATEVRAAAAAVGGTASRFRGGTRADVFHPPAAAVLALQQRVKQQLDPQGIFNPGRLYPAF